MRPLAPATDKGRTVGGDDVHHKTRDTNPGYADNKAKSLRHAARQEGRRAARNIQQEGKVMAYETTLQDSPVCPHCGHEHTDAFEWNFGPCLDGSIKGRECDSCGEGERKDLKQTPQHKNYD